MPNLLKMRSVHSLSLYWVDGNQDSPRLTDKAERRVTSGYQRVRGKQMEGDRSKGREASKSRFRSATLGRP